MFEPAAARPMVSTGGRIRIEDAGPVGMITVRGDLGRAALRKAVGAVTGAPFPEVRRASLEGDNGLFWMAPDELLVRVAHDRTEAAVAAISKALGKAHGLVVDVSDARTTFRLSGEGIRETLARLTPADMHPDGLPPGEVRRTRLAQVPVAFWFAEPERVELVCFRSVGRYVFDLLENAARPGDGPGIF